MKPSRFPTRLLASLFVLAPAAALAGSLHGTITCKGLRSNAGAVVSLTPSGGEIAAPPAEHAVMNQKGKQFLPRVLAVQVGTTVDFLNDDPFAHSVMTPDKCAGKFNLGSWPQGEKKSFTFDKPCNAVILCKIHPEMVGYVVAVETPYFAVTADDGTYEIKDVPDGNYKLSIWHERLREQTQDLSVKGDGALDLTLKR